MVMDCVKRRLCVIIEERMDRVQHCALVCVASDVLKVLLFCIIFFISGALYVVTLIMCMRLMFCLMCKSDVSMCFNVCCAFVVIECSPFLYYGCKKVQRCVNSCVFRLIYPPTFEGGV